MVKIKELVEKFEKRVKKRIYIETRIKEEGKVSFFEMITPAFVGGIIIGIIVGVPGLSLFLPAVLIGGYIAAKLVGDYYERYIGEIDAAKVGAFAGFIGAFFGALIMLIIAVFFAESAVGFFESFMDPSTAEFVLILSGLDPYISLNTLRLRFLINFVCCGVLGALGGVLYVRKITGRL